MIERKKISFAVRWQKRGTYAGFDLICAFAAMVVMFLNLPESANADPVIWVVADVCAAILLLMLEFGRGDAWARLFSNFILCCIGFLMLWVVSDGVVVPPLLFVAYLFRAWRIYLTNPRGSMEEIIRVTIAAMAAGIPAGIVGGLFGWKQPAQFIGVEGFYLISAWIHLYPLYEWFFAEEPTDPDERKNI